jgi:hypothetical protein
VTSLQAALRGRLCPFFALFFFYMLTTSRERPWSDGTPIWEVAESIADHHTFEISTRWPASLELGRGGKIYALSPLLPSLVHLPGAGLKHWLFRFAPDKSGLWRAICSHIGPSALAALTTILFLGFCTERFGRRAALVLGAALAFGTTIWVYARYPYSEILQAACFTGLFLELLRVVDRPTRGHALGAGVWGGLLINAKLAFAPVGLGAALFVLWSLRKQPRVALRVLLWAAVAGVPLLGIILFYNWARWGSALHTGFGAGGLAATENASVGLWGMLMSPNKSLFLYSPPLLLALLALPRAWRAWRRYYLLLALVGLPPLIVHARMVFWSGDWAWGPRYCVFIVPALLLPAGLLFQRAGEAPPPAWVRRARGAGLAGVIACGVLVQALGCVFLWDHFIRITLAVNRSWLGGRTCATPCFEEHHAFQWVPPFNAILGHWWLYGHIRRGDSWKVAQLDAPWRRYTTQDMYVGDAYARAVDRLDWWYLDYRKDFRGLGAGIFAGLGLGLATSAALFYLQERRRARAALAPASPAELEVPS